MHSGFATTLVVAAKVDLRKVHDNRGRNTVLSNCFPRQPISVDTRVQDRENGDSNTLDPEVLHTNKFRQGVLLSQHSQ
jgi:hypothetical protein